MSLEGQLEYESENIEEYFGEFDGFDEGDFLEMEPESPTLAKPGSEEKVLMLAARYAAGLPLWHSDDCYEFVVLDLSGDGIEKGEFSLIWDEVVEIEEDKYEGNFFSKPFGCGG